MPRIQLTRVERQCKTCDKTFLSWECHKNHQFCSRQCHHNHLRNASPLIDRLVLGTKKMPSGCIEWQKSKHTRGYGLTTVNNKSISTHRVSYELFVGPIPDGIFVCHRCDNPPCINPLHLFLGTPNDNMNDMFTKGRNADLRGHRNGGAKLTADDVIEIRRRRANGELLRTIAADFGISESTASQIFNRLRWAHV